MNIGQTIKKLRKQRGLNQIEFAKKINITQASLSQIETGITQPHNSTLIRICEALETPQEILYVLSINEDQVPADKLEIFNAAKDLMFKVFYTLLAIWCGINSTNFK